MDATYRYPLDVPFPSPDLTEKILPFQSWHDRYLGHEGINGWVYLVTALELNCTKVGISFEKHSGVRTYRIKSSMPCTVLTRAVILVARPRVHEVNLHDRFKELRIRRTEWFRLSELQILDAINYLYKVEVKEEGRD